MNGFIGPTKCASKFSPASIKRLIDCSISLTPFLISDLPININFTGAL